MQVAAFLREVTPGTYKVSLRSNDAVDVSAFAAQYGGGGHPRAAGCVLHGRRDDIIVDLVHRLEGILSRRLS